MKLSTRLFGPFDDDGPCYDFCYCPHCWNGWDNIPFWRRVWEHLRWRFQYVIEEGLVMHRWRRLACLFRGHKRAWEHQGKHWCIRCLRYVRKKAP